MNILDEIKQHKVKEVDQRKSLFPVKLLEQSLYYTSQPVSMKKYLSRPDKQGIIAEIKRKSPSRGILNDYVSIERTSIGYMQAGASGLSVLTDQDYFGGKNEDLTQARKFNFCPILRKDFVVEEYQIIESKSIGADIILLIAAILTPNQIKNLAGLAKSLEMEVLLEVHNENELNQSLHDSVDLVGINNRDLKTFKTDLNTSFKLAKLVPDEFTMVSESGISEPSSILELKQAGFKGFLIGENFMVHGRPEHACARFIEQLKKLELADQKDEIKTTD